MASDRTGPTRFYEPDRRILIVEDDPNLAFALSDALASQGYFVETAGEGSAAIEKATACAFDLVLLDVLLPGQDGFTVCRELRERGINTAILMLTGRVETIDKVRGLDAGADDYLTKPFDVRELLARIQALLRRTRQRPLMRFQFGTIVVDFLEGRVFREGRRVDLASKELHLLRYLISRRGVILTREELLTEVWGYQSTNTRTLDVHVATLRQKLEIDPERPRYIVTVRHSGYMFRL